MLDLFNPWVILRAQLHTLRDFDTGAYSPVGFGLFFGFPLLAAFLLLAILEVVLTERAADVLITSMSIFTALLLNLQMLVFDAVNRGRADVESREEREWRRVRSQFLREIFANISFAILTSIVVVVILLTWVTLSDSWQGGREFFSAAVFYGTGLFLVTLFMVLQRVHVLFERQFSDGGG